MTRFAMNKKGGMQQIEFRSKVSANISWLEHNLAGLDCGIKKAKNGSECEDQYVLEKLEKMCNILGFDLVKK